VAPTTSTASATAPMVALGTGRLSRPIILPLQSVDGFI
jgi:hypothetical protein